LLTKTTIYQSADYRLTGLDTRQWTDESTKLVTFQYPNWHGLLTYTGIGRWQRKQTSQFAIDWVAGTQGQDIQQIGDRLRERGDAWLAEIERQEKRYRHSFILAAFDERGSHRAALE